MPFTTSATRPEYSAKTLSRSASRTFWKITCFAVCAAIRPSTSVGFGNSISWPSSSSAPGKSVRASSRPSWVSGISTVSTTFFTAKTSIWPVSSLKRLRRSSAPL